MKSQSLIILALFLVQALSLTFGPFYQIDKRRYQDLLTKLNDLKEDSDDQAWVLQETIFSFAFTCEQVLSILNTYTKEIDKVDALSILKDNIVDPQNKAIILDSFERAILKREATDLFDDVYPCVVLGTAAAQIPVVELPYRDQWNQTDLEVLIRKINKTPFSSDKLAIAEEGITNSSSFLTPEQAVLLYESFSFSSDMLTLTEFLKDRIVGLTCDQVISILNRFYFQSDKIEALKAFKESIIDAENKFIIVESFFSSTYRAQAQKILDSIHGKNELFGAPTGKVLFVLDYSGSMSTGLTFNGQKMTRLELVKKEFARTLASFNSSVHFNVMAYASANVAWKDSLEKATKSNIEDAIKFTNKYHAEGGTDMYYALQEAWAMDEVETIYLLTDGAPNEGITDINKLVADVRTWYNKTPIKVNTIAFLMGTHSSDNKPASRNLMRAIADATGGTYRAVESTN